MRLIDADALQARIMMDAPDFLDGGSTITKAFIMAMIGTKSVTPTIDAVQVVRCKDCKHFDCCRLYKCQIHGSLFQPKDADWYCADGEKR